MSAKYYSETIQKGSNGDSVKEWQNYLNSQGWNLTVDGIFGDKTDAATKEYQTKYGLTVDGIVGKNTWGQAGYSDISTPISAPKNTPAPVMPTFNNTAFTDTEEGKAKAEAKDTAYSDWASDEGHKWANQTVNDEILKEYLNRKDFSYNFNEDALYQQYKDKYIQQGKLAMADTIGQASAMTGGYGNSYAATVGNQAYQASLQNLNDIIPELYQMAYDRYNQKGQDMLNQLSVLNDDYARSYGEWQTKYGMLKDKVDYTNSDFYNSANLYGTEQDRANNLAQQNYQNEFGAWQENTDNAQWQAQFDEDTRRYAEQMLLSKQSGSGGSNSGGGANVTVDENGNLVVNNSGGSGVTSAMQKKASEFKSNDDLADWAYGLADAGTITEDEADGLIAMYADPNEKYVEKENENGSKSKVISFSEMVKSDKGWEVENNGGWNLFGIDNNAIVTAPNGQKIRLDQLKDKLISEGMDKKEAKNAIKKLQQVLGISSNWLGGL